MKTAGSAVPSVDYDRRMAFCPQCHKRYSRTGNRQVYCSPTCRGKAYRSTSRRLSRGYQLRRKLRDLGIDRDVYDSLLIAQDNRCGICLRHGTNKLRLAIDHSHTTGRVRGLLCRNCNGRVLPTFENDPGRAERLAEWLAR